MQQETPTPLHYESNNRARDAADTTSVLRLYVSNLSWSFGAIIVCALLAYLASYAVGFLFYREALTFKWAGGSISTRTLDQFEVMRSTLVVIGCAAGLAASQTVFLVRHLRRMGRAPTLGESAAERSG